MPVELKFCGLTLEADAACAAELGAAYVGAIFVGGPRLVTPQRARAIFDAAGGGPQRVGVFSTEALESVAASARIAGVDIAQLHGDPKAADVRYVRSRFQGMVWAVVRVEGSLLPDWSEELFREADAVLLDSRVGPHGGSGVTLPWRALALSLSDVRGDTRVVLAGGLKPENVAEAVGLLAPNAVDVSSGVESAPGIKDHARMRAFAKAAREAAK